MTTHTISTELFFEEGTGKPKLTKNQLVKVGRFTDMFGRDVEITRADLESMVKNFYANAMDMKRRGKVQAPINYSHEKGKKAAGWIHDLELQEVDGVPVLYAKTEWVGEGKKAIEDGEFSFISAEIDFDFADKKTGEKVGPTLRGAGLTNTPAVPGLESLLSETTEEEREGLKQFILNNKERETKLMEFDQILEVIKQLPDDQKAIIRETLGELPIIEKEVVTEPDMEAPKKDPNMADVEPEGDKLTLTALRDEMKKLKEELLSSKAALATAQKEAQFAELLQKGLAVSAQKQAFLSGDIAAFAQVGVSKELNFQEHGTAKDAALKEEIKTSAQAQDKVLVLAEALVAKLAVDGKKISRPDAVSAVLSENPELSKLYHEGV